VDLLALFFQRFGERVVVLDDRERSTKNVWPEPDFSCTRPCTASGGPSARQAVAPALLRHVAAGESVALRARELVELLHEVAAQALDRRAQRVEPRRRRVLIRPSGSNVGSRSRGGLEVRERAEKLRQRGKLRALDGTATRAPSERSTRRKRSRRSSGSSARFAGPRRATSGAPSSTPASAMAA